jgi:outer membrane protein assembly factor BamB
MIRPFAIVAVLLALSATVAVASAPSAPAPPEVKRTDWPMYGGTHSRNMVNLTDRNILDNFDVETGDGILWKAELGSHSFTQPIVAGGKVFIGTDNGHPRNKRDSEKIEREWVPLYRSVLMCFDERTGKFLWQAVHDPRPSGGNDDWIGADGIASTPAVEGNRVYYISNRAEVMCVDANGFADGNQGFQGEKYKDATDADIIWSFDMAKELKVFPRYGQLCSGSLVISSPLIVGDIVFVVTGNGVGSNFIDVASSEAPSFIALDKKKGKFLWNDNSPGKHIMLGQWGSPSYTAEPVPQVIFPAANL